MIVVFFSVAIGTPARVSGLRFGDLPGVAACRGCEEKGGMMGLSAASNP
jgi:hypothetical protein